MANLVIVAIPREDDYVWKISSEKVPHMTILHLGEMPVPNFAQIAGFVQHAATRTLGRFGMEVDRRGDLGPEPADVLFFEKNKWSGYEDVAAFRSHLLHDANIKAAYDSSLQFPEWLPHLTLGYPETPAREDTRDYPGITYVGFDKIALWFSEYSGVEFTLERNDALAEVAMGGSTADRVKLGRRNVGELLHYGVKGMKWGVRRDRSSRVSIAAKGKKLKTSGGAGRKPSEDAKRAAVIGRVGKKSGLQALTNKQLQDYQARLNLEASVRRLEYQKKNRGQKFVDDLINKSGNTATDTVAQEVVAKRVKKALTAAALAAA